MNSTQPSQPRTSTGPLAWVGFALVFVPLLVRATSATTNLPAWDLDPTIFSLGSPAIGPAGSMLVDVAVLIGAAALFLAEARARKRVGWPLLALGLIGSLACFAHGWLLPSPESGAIRGSLGNQRIGMAWVSAVWAALAVGHAGRDEHFRRAGIGVLLAFVALLAMRGIQEIYVEHAVTMATYKADPQKFIESRGWTVDSTMARQFIRRISQPEASGWFGLSNVFASFGVFATVVGLGWLAGVVRARDMQAKLAATSAAAAAFGLGLLVLFLSDSKGGIAFAAFGVALLIGGAVASVRLARRRCLRFLAGPACVALVLAAIAVRGVIGERIHELSVLFRAFYIEAALRIFAHHPQGVGPDGFQPAYLLAKNPLNPEEVQSPHSILFDWLATLGIAGVAWCAVTITASGFMGRRLLATEPPVDARSSPSSGDQTGAKVAMLTIAAATITAAWLQSPLITPDIAAVRVGGLILGCLIAFALCRGNSGGAWLRRGLAAGALALLAHGQIDVTMSLSASAGLALSACALAAAPDLNRLEASSPGKSAVATSVVLTMMAGCIAWAGCRPAWRWQQALENGAEHARVVATFAERLSFLQSGKSSPLYPRDSREKFVSDLAAELGRPVPASQPGVEAALLAIDRQRLSGAATELEHAMMIEPSEWRVAREAGRLHLRLASGYLHSDEPGKADAAAALALQTISPPLSNGVPVGSAAWMRALALAEEGYGRERANQDLLGKARGHLDQVTKLDPYNLDVVVRLFRLSGELNLGDDRKRWAQRALELDHLARLDQEVKGLSAKERAEIEAAAR